MSEAQSLSNLCFQKASEIDKRLSKIGLYNEVITHEGDKKIIYKTDPMPSNIKQLILKKASYHALQAFLMDAMKNKDRMLELLRLSEYEHSEKRPPSAVVPDKPILELVDEAEMFNQLDSEKYNDFLEKEAIAAHVGKFIHKNSILDHLRSKAYDIVNVRWIEVKKEEKTLVEIEPHYNPEDYEDIHVMFAKIHRDAESKVNYYKAMIKNMVAEENDKRRSEYAIEMQKFHKEWNERMEKANSELKAYTEKLAKAQNKFEQEKLKKINELSQLKIVLDPRFNDLYEELNS